MSDLLGIGASGIRAYRTALSVIGDNVANAENLGYARRDVLLRESATASATSPLSLSRTRFGGVEAAAIRRAWDDFKAADARSAAADAGHADARMRWLSVSEAAIDDGDAGVGAKLTAFFNAGEALAADPGGAVPRGGFLATLGDAAGAIRDSADALARASDGIATEASATVDGINASLAGLVRLNASLARAGSGTSTQASLADERDRLLDDLSAKLGVEVSLDGKGAATVRLGDGTALVEGTSAASVSVTAQPDGTLAIGIDGRAAVGVGGALGGLVDAAAFVAGRRERLDAIATDFAAALNGWSAQGRDAGGNPGGALLAIGAGAATLQLATSDPDAIAAAAPGGASNGNLLALSSLRSVETELSGLVTDQATAVASAKAEAETTATIRDSAFVARDSIAGVDLDREAAELIRFQQAYDASARILQVARETMQTMLGVF